jgi:hypothetical protein
MFDELIEILKNQDMHFGETFKKVIKTGILYFAQKPCDSIDLNPILYVKYNPTLLRLSEYLLTLLSFKI